MRTSPAKNRGAGSSMARCVVPLEARGSRRARAAPRWRRRGAPVVLHDVRRPRTTPPGSRPARSSPPRPQAIEGRQSTGHAASSTATARSAPGPDADRLHSRVGRRGDARQQHQHRGAEEAVGVPEDRQRRAPCSAAASKRRRQARDRGDQRRPPGSARPAGPGRRAFALPCRRPSVLASRQPTSRRATVVTHEATTTRTTGALPRAPRTPSRCRRGTARWPPARRRTRRARRTRRTGRPVAGDPVGASTSDGTSHGRLGDHRQQQRAEGRERGAGRRHDAQRSRAPPTSAAAGDQSAAKASTRTQSRPARAHVVAERARPPARPTAAPRTRRPSPTGR